MRLFSLLTFLLITACSGDERDAQTNVNTQGIGVAEKASFKAKGTGWFEDSRVTQYLVLTEKSLNISTLLYSRISPEAAAQIKSVKMPPEAKDVARCLVEKVKENGIEEQFDQSMKFTQEYFEYVEKTPSLTLLNLDQDSRLQGLQVKMNAGTDDSKMYQAVIKECNVIKMNIKASKSTGVMEAVKAMRGDASNE